MKLRPVNTSSKFLPPFSHASRQFMEPVVVIPSFTNSNSMPQSILFKKYY